MGVSSRPHPHQLEDAVSRLETSLRIWNGAAAKAGFAGSEYYDNPERVFARVRDMRRTMMRVIVQLKLDRGFKPSGEDVEIPLNLRQRNDFLKWITPTLQAENNKRLVDEILELHQRIAENEHRIAQLTDLLKWNEELDGKS